MIQHFIKSAWRNLVRNKALAGLNIAGLSIGIASFVLIMLFVNFERSYDRFFENSDRIYRVYMDYFEGESYYAGDAQTYNNSGPTLKNIFPDIREYVRMYQLNKTSIVYNNSVFEITNGHLADPSWFHIFRFPLIQGNEETALNQPNTIVLTKNTANKIFGSKPPIGETVKLFHDGKMGEFTVSGVLKNIPENTYIKTNFLVSYSSNKTWPVCNHVLNWNNNNLFTYILTYPGINEEELRSKITQYNWEDYLSKERHNIELLADVHLHSNKPYEAEANGNARSVNFLLAIALIILVLSWLNYTNLSIAKSMERAKETGVRKSNGAKRIQLLVQFLIESVFLNAIAILCAAILVVLVLPVFNNFTNKNLFEAIQGSSVYFFMVLVMVVGSILSGLYPALLLSNFKLTEILKGKNKLGGHLKSRSVFVSVQFVASITLIIGTLLIAKQIRFLQKQPLGFNNELIVSVKGEILSEANTNGGIKVLKDQIQQLPSVQAVSCTQTFPGEGFYELNSMMGIILPNGVEDKQSVWYNHFIDEHYIPLMQLEFLVGRNYRYSENSEKVLLINEKAAGKMGFDNARDALNQVVRFWGNERQIVGVLKDYRHFGVKTEVEPMILTYSQVPSNRLLVKFDNKTASASGIQNSINQIEQLWKGKFQESTFEYEFIDKTFAAQYEEDLKFGKVFGAFAGLAIFIAVLGLIGLASYICNQRSKEIGIRKVNGARVSEILTMLNTDFIKWVVIAFVLACPIAWFAMNKWLENFAYKTTLSWWIFALAGLLTLGIALLTVSLKSWRTATRNPIESLRYE